MTALQQAVASVVHATVEANWEEKTQSITFPEALKHVHTYLVNQLMDGRE